MQSFSFQPKTYIYPIDQDMLFTRILFFYCASLYQSRETLGCDGYYFLSLISDLHSYFSLFLYMFFNFLLWALCKVLEVYSFLNFAALLKFIDTEQFQRQVSLSCTSSSVVVVVDLSLLHADCKYMYFVWVFVFILAAICLFVWCPSLIFFFFVFLFNTFSWELLLNYWTVLSFVFQASWS